MNFDTARLLKLAPLAALMVIVNQSRGTRLNPNQIRASQVVALDERRTQVLLEAYTPEDPFATQIYKGKARFVYKRLDLATFFGEHYKLDADLPTTSYNLLDKISRATGIVFDQNDFDNQVVRGTPFRLVAKPGSLRWVGELFIDLNQGSGLVDLADIIVNTELNGLVYGTGLIELSTVVQERTLDGLVSPYVSPTLTI